MPGTDPLSARDLAAFVAAVETGSVQGAADALDLTQSAATKRIRAIERRLGTTLLHRGRFGVRPTEAGRLAYPAAKEALVALAGVESAVAAPAAAPTLRLSASRTIGEFLLPGWLAAFRATARDPFRAQVEIANSTAVLEAIRGGRADVGFVEGLDPLHGLASTLLLRDEIVAVVAPGHPWSRRRNIAAGDLPAEPYLTREAGSGTRAVAAAALAARGVTLEPTLEAASSESLKRAVLAGGFTLLSRLAVEDEVRAGTLTALAVSGADLTRELRAVRVRTPASDGPPKRLWSFLVRSRAIAPRTTG